MTPYRREAFWGGNKHLYSDFSRFRDALPESP